MRVTRSLRRRRAVGCRGGRDVFPVCASDEAAFVQGAAYVADGGRMDKL